jgi:NAD(P) transhydrogenase subunit alpha
MDIAIDQGGNCAATEPGEFVQKEGVHICGIQNIPGRMAVHASWLYANNMYHYVANLFKNGVGTLDLDDEIAKESLVTYQGKIVFEGALKAMGFHYVQ